MFTEYQHQTAVNHYRPPEHVAKEIIAHAFRKFPEKAKVMKHCYHDKKVNYNTEGLKHPKHMGGNLLQWAFLN